MSDFQKTNLWQTTLAPQPNDDAGAARERLRAAFLLFRERASVLAGEISRSLPDYTVHDITHLDALWEMADILVGRDHGLSPCDVFVLGGAFLIHDLGNGLAAYPGGKAAIESMPEFIDAVATAMRRKLGRSPTPADLAIVPHEVYAAALGDTLRNLHARQAGRLALVAWRDENGREYHLLEDPEMRAVFGSIIGQIAHSHWWSVRRLAQDFEIVLGAPYWCPTNWTVDPLRLACILRTADISHIDSRRAPGFLKSVRAPAGGSMSHWQFQEKLNRAQLADGRLMYTSGTAFPPSEAEAWWLCYQAICAIDTELSRVDALLADTGRKRLLCGGVAGADDPARLARFVPVDGWLPMDTAIKVGDIPTLIRKLGGEELYGKDSRIPLRELIQNSTDAIVARRLLEDRAEDWGRIRVGLRRSDRGAWLDVQDDGIGMSRDTMAGPLLDFGTSYWASWRVREEHPGLLAKGFAPIGKFGIGFFSVFMIADVVLVFSRRPEDGKAATHVLEFRTGVATPPLLRVAIPAEQLNEPGTVVRLLLRTDPEMPGGLLRTGARGGVRTLSEVCAWIAPCSRVTIIADQFGSGPREVVAANDWLLVDDDQLVRRLFEPHRSDALPQKILRLGAGLHFVRNEHGNVLARACIIPEHRRLGLNDELVPGGDVGAVCVGGLRSCATIGTAGVWVGESLNASRTLAVPVASAAHLKDWIAEQVPKLLATYGDEHLQLGCAQLVCAMGGDCGDLPIAYGSEGYLTTTQVRDLAERSDTLMLVESEYGPPSDRVHGEYELLANVIGVNEGMPGLIWSVSFDLRGRDWPNVPAPIVDARDPQYWAFAHRTTFGRVIELIADVWRVPLSELIDRFGAHREPVPVGRTGAGVVMKRFARILTRKLTDGEVGKGRKVRQSRKQRKRPARKINRRKP